MTVVAFRPKDPWTYSGPAALVPMTMTVVISLIFGQEQQLIKGGTNKYQVDVVCTDGPYNCQVEEQDDVGPLLTHLRAEAVARGELFEVYNQSGEPPSLFGIQPSELRF